jgi:hypothetical protein
MSEIRATTISDAAGTGPITLTKQSAAKAWCHFTTVSTTAVNESFNVASLTDTGTGDTNVNLTNAFTSASIVAGFNVGDGSSGDQSFIQSSTTASSIHCFNYNGANAVFDSSLCAVSGQGDLA